MNKTYLIVISSDSNLTPKALFYYLVELGLRITIKETCYGLLIEGNKEEVEKAIKKAKEIEPNKVFVKERGYPIWDPRICRMKQKGGPRPGFLQLEAEYKILPLISEALKDARPEIRLREKKRVKADEIVKILNLKTRSKSNK